jgi:sigma-B regulation protein RsbU (phosphoserine phosphatase)
MRIFPRITRPSLRPLRQRWRRWRQHLTVARVTVAVEVLIFTSALLIVLSGSRAGFVDQLGPRADLAVTLLWLVLFALVHALVKRHLLPRIERYFSPVPYDERRVLFDLGQEAHTAASIDELYESIAKRISESFEAENASIFVRDEKSGDYLCRISCSQPDGTTNGADSEAKQKLKLARGAFMLKRLQSLSAPLVIEPTEFDTWERAFAGAPPQLRAARERERETLQRIKAHLLVRIRTKDQVIGVLSLGLRRGQFQYSPADKEVLMSVAAQLALVIENSRLAERLLAEERLRRELALAAEVQRRLLPSHPPEGLSVELAGFCQPARGVGGDYYDFITFDNQQLGIAIADVAGKGMAAALLMSTVQATLRSLSATTGAQAHANRSLADMVATLNRLLCNSTGGANYVTFFYGQVDQLTQQLAYVNAGHNPPLFLRADPAGDFTQLSTGGLVVGMFDDCRYEQDVVQMQPGDVLIAFTDGLSEAHDERGEEFGETRIKKVLAATAHLSVNEIRDEMVRQVKEWCASASQYDDLTFIVMKVK